MKNALLFILLTFFLSFQNHVNGQNNYSLDSIVNVNVQFNPYIQVKDIVKSKDFEGRPLLIEQFRGNDRNNELNIFSIEEITYHPNGNRKTSDLKFCFQKGDSCLFRHHLDYLDDGQVINAHVLGYNFNDTPDTLIISNFGESWDTTFFDNQNRPLETRVHTSIDMAPKELFSTTEHFRVGDQLDSSYQFRYNLGMKQFFSKTLYAYDLTGNLEQSTVYNFRNAITQTSFFEFDNQDREIKRRIEYLSGWSAEVETEYGANDSFIKIMDKGIDPSGVEHGSNIYTTFYHEKNIPDSTSNQARSNPNDPFVLSSYSNYFYSGISSATNLTSSRNFYIFPNPSSESIQYEFGVKNDLRPKIGKIINLNGKIEKRFIISQHEPLSISELAPGSYFLKIEGFPAKLFTKN